MSIAGDTSPRIPGFYAGVRQKSSASAANNTIIINSGDSGIAPTISNIGPDSAGPGLGINITARNGIVGSQGTRDGAPINLTAGNAVSASAGAIGLGGSINLQAGTGAGSGGSTGGAINLIGGQAGPGNSIGGAINLLGGVGTNARGGNINIQSRGGNGGLGGNIVIETLGIQGQLPAGDITIRTNQAALGTGTYGYPTLSIFSAGGHGGNNMLIGCGNVNGSGRDAGGIVFTSGNSQFAGGGVFTFNAGTGATTGGSFTFNGGTGTTTGSNITMSTGTSSTGNPGTYTINLGNTTASSGNNAGTFIIQQTAANAARTTAGTGGNGSTITFNTGAGTNNTTTTGITQGGIGGTLTSTLGAGGTATGASATGTGGKGGSYTWTAGNGGNGTTTGGAGGDFSITLGNAGTGGNANAGRLNITGGTATGTGTLSTVNLSSASLTLTNGYISRGAPVTKTTNFTLAVGENYVIVDNSTSADTVVTLPSAASQSGREVSFTIYPGGGGNLVSASSNVVPLGGGAAGTAIADNGSWAKIVSDGTNWIVLQLGNNQDIVQNSQSADYTLVSSDNGKQIFHPSADTTPRTWTIPANSSVPFSIGTVVTFINQNGAGTITIAITTDTMRLAGSGSTGSRTLAGNGIATAVKVTTTEWIINGTGLT